VNNPNYTLNKPGKWDRKNLSRRSDRLHFDSAIFKKLNLQERRRLSNDHHDRVAIML